MPGATRSKFLCGVVLVAAPFLMLAIACDVNGLTPDGGQQDHPDGNPGDVTGNPESSADCAAPAKAVSGHWTAWSPPGMDASGQAPTSRGYSSLAWGRSGTTSFALLFGGGSLNAGILGDAWGFDSASQEWSPLSAGPSARGGHMLAFAGDVLGTPSPSDAFVLFGGQANTYLSDTWTFTDNKWSTVCGADAGAKSCGPSPRAYHSMAYDSMRSEVIVFGGRDDAGPRRDTWAFSMTDQSWSPRCATDCDGGAECCSAPTARSEQSMAYDVDRHVIVLFGGKDVNGAYLADTWEWDGAKWTEHHGSEGPGARSGHAMSGGPSSYGVVLFGGTDKSGPAPNPLWVWDGGDWTSVVVEGAAPIPRAYGAMSLDYTTSTLLLFGGGSTGELNDTWTLSLERTLVDAGCPSGPDSAPSITTCAQLQLCCASLANTLEQQACEAIVAAADEDTCQTVRAGFVDAGTCH